MNSKRDVSNFAAKYAYKSKSGTAYHKIYDMGVSTVRKL